MYHVADEFVVEKMGSKSTRRPDVVLFVNGIPLVVIECKRSDKSHHGDKAVMQGVEQQLVYQSEGEIPHLYMTSQLLLAVSPFDVRYATTATPKKFWSLWRESEVRSPGSGVRDGFDEEVGECVNREVDREVWEKILLGRSYAAGIRKSIEEVGERMVTEQDRVLYALLRPERLLKLAYQFIVFDGGIKKIARYQQFFAVEATMQRVGSINNQGTRTGGVIWHTTGSGKSLTMVMLAKALALHPGISNPRVGYCNGSGESGQPDLGDVSRLREVGRKSKGWEASRPPCNRQTAAQRGSS